MPTHTLSFHACAFGMLDSQILATLPFADAARSPSLYRALFIPYVSEHKVWYGSYYLLRRVRGCDQADKCGDITLGENTWKVHPVRA